MTKIDWPFPPAPAKFNEWFKLLGIQEATPADVTVAWACYPHIKKAQALIADHRKRSKDPELVMDRNQIQYEATNWINPDESNEPDEPEDDDTQPGGM